MILKDITGKIRRFVLGRIAAARERTSVGVPESSLHRFLIDGGAPRQLAVLYSGDGGWARLTTHLARRLQSEGILVAGIDCMHYFWEEKTPAVAGRDLAGVLRELLDATGADEIFLLGYSMGADILPSIARQLPAELLDRVTRIVLMSPGHRAQLKFRFIGWLGFHTPETTGIPLRPDVEALSASIPISCFAGENEVHTLARDLGPEVAKTEFLPGGHHYGSDYETLADRVIEHLRP
jgi:type IV secretory pathway VirJ component